MQSRALLVFIALSFSGVPSLAQMDPSSALLLNSERTTRENSIDSGRYSVRPKEVMKREEQKPGTGRKSTGRDGEEDAETLTPVTVVIPDPPETASSAPVPSSDPKPPPAKPTPVPPSLSQPTQAVATSPAPAPAPSPAQSAVPPRELSRRMNLVEISISPGYLYSNSESESFYRRYSVAASVLSVEASVWLNPLFALVGGYTASMSGHVNDSLTGVQNIPATHEWFTAGIRSRQFFGSDALANSLTMGIDYYDYRFRVPSDASSRHKLSSLGARISLEAEMPVNFYRSWILGVSLVPKLQHKEETTALQARSGGSVDANAVSLSLGGRLQFERKNAVTWKLSHSVEKALYSGDTSDVDPATSQVLSGVSVISSVTMFTIGFTWGN